MKIRLDHGLSVLAGGVFVTIGSMAVLLFVLFFKLGYETVGQVLVAVAGISFVVSSALFRLGIEDLKLKLNKIQKREFVNI